MTAKQQTQIVELETVKLEMKVKKLWVRVLKEVLEVLKALEQIFTPTKSRIENGYKLRVVGIFLGFITLCVFIIFIK